MDSLPSLGTVNDWNIMRLILAQRQIAKKLTPDQRLCLLSDEFSKMGKAVEGFHVADDIGELKVLGLRQLTTKSAKDTLTVLKEILVDIDTASNCATNDISPTYSHKHHHNHVR